MDIYILSIVLFIFAVAVIELLLYSWRGSRDVSRARKTTRRLKEHSWEKQWADASGEIVKTRVLSAIPVFNSVLMKIDMIGRLERLIRQANVAYPPGAFLILSPLLGIIGFYSGEIFLRSAGLALLCCAICALLPFAHLRLKKSIRMKKFEVQLPEALDLIARSLKAGHAFTGGIKLAAENFPDPLGTEFEETLNEINFGLSVPEALKNLGGRIDSPDLRFFIVSTILQRETGGNLAEITENIAHIIRERFKFNDKVRVLAAEGKISAAILIALPFVMFFVILNLNPDYLSVLMQEQAGKIAITSALVLMLAGIVTILKMIRINV